MTSFFNKVGEVIATVGLFVAGLFGFTPEPTVVDTPVDIEEPGDVLGADTVLPIAGTVYYLAGTGISSSATSFTLTTFTLPQTGYKIQDTDLSDTFYITFEPGNRTRQEIASCTTVTQNANDTATISGCSRGLLPVSPYTASTTYQFAHGGGTAVVFSNPPQLLNEAAMKGNDETITGQWTFSIFPITASTSIASATTSGIVELATGAEAASSTVEGDIAGSKLALSTTISTSSAPTSGNVVVVTGDDGNIDSDFLSNHVGSSTIRYYTVGTSTWTKPDFLRHIVVEIQGPGGGGGGCTADSADYGFGAGGGGGGYTRLFRSSSDLTASSYSVYVGAATTTLSSTFGGVATATAGTAGGACASTAPTGGAGGTGSGGQFSLTGQQGDGGSDVNHSSQVTAGGRGGNSRYGFGASAVPTDSTGVTGQNGVGYGSGGSGGLSYNGANASGGSGANGIVIIYEYFY